MSPHVFIRWLLLAVSLSHCLAIVQAAEQLEIATTVELLSTITRPGEGTKSIFVPAIHVREGEEVYYTIRIRNTGQNPALPVTVVKPIPRNTRYVEDSASGPAADIQYSADGGSTFASAQQLTSKRGREHLTVDNYTHIRWQLRYALAPGAVALLRFRVVFK